MQILVSISLASYTIIAATQKGSHLLRCFPSLGLKGDFGLSHTSLSLSFIFFKAVLQADLCPSHALYVDALTPSTSECNHIWRQGLESGN